MGEGVASILQASCGSLTTACNQPFSHQSGGVGSRNCHDLIKLFNNCPPTDGRRRETVLRQLPTHGNDMPPTRVWVKQGLNSHRSAQVLLVPLGNIPPDVYAKYCEILRRFRCDRV